MDNPLRAAKKFSLADAETPGQLTDPPVPSPEPPEPPYVTGGPPFPAHPTDGGKYGISILDYFAAHVMAGLAMRADMSIDDLKIDGAKHAYWIAAMMVDLRDELPIEETPVPTDEEPPPPVFPPPLPAEAAHATTVRLGGPQLTVTTPTTDLRPSTSASSA